MKGFRYFAILLCTGLLFHDRLEAQEVQARATIDSAKVMIGDQIKVHLELDQAQGMKIAFPVIGDSLSPTVEVLERSPLDTILLDKKDQIKIIQNLTVTSFDTGRQVIPPFYFKMSYKDLNDTVETLPVEFFVRSMSIDTKRGPVDIKMPYSAPLTLKEVAPYILGVILIGSLIFFLFYYIKRKKNNQPVFGKAIKPKEPAHIVAIRMLDHIKEEKLWQQNLVKKYYSEISDTLRIYIQDRFGIKAMEYTTDEILSAFSVQKELIPEKSFGELKNILFLADLVKFAKYEPLPDDNNLTLMNSYFFVNATKPEEKKPDQPADDEREGEEVVLK